MKKVKLSEIRKLVAESKNEEAMTEYVLLSILLKTAGIEIEDV